MLIIFNDQQNSEKRRQNDKLQGAIAPNAVSYPQALSTVLLFY